MRDRCQRADRRNCQGVETSDAAAETCRFRPFSMLTLKTSADGLRLTPRHPPLPPHFVWFLSHPITDLFDLRPPIFAFDKSVARIDKNRSEVDISVTAVRSGGRFHLQRSIQMSRPVMSRSELLFRCTPHVSIAIRTIARTTRNRVALTKTSGR
jgi:hypothetical protein